MKNKFLTIFFVFIYLFTHAQETSKYSFSLGIGRGYDDGLVYLPSMPTIHLGLDYEIIEWISIEMNIFSYYRHYGDSYLIKEPIHDYPIMDIVVEESFGPFATKEMIDKIKNTGIKDIKMEWELKAMSIPLTIGVLFSSPLLYRHHKIGIMLGLGVGFYSYNWPKDYTGIEEIVLKDGTVYKDLFISLNTEFRNITPFEHICLSYSYCLKDISFGFRISELSRRIGWQHHMFDSSIFVKLKI